MNVFHRARVPTIRDRQWSLLEPLFAGSGSTIEPAQLRSASGVKRTAAVALVLGLFEEHFADLFWLTYHCDAQPVARRPYGSGFQPVPWHCPECECIVDDASDLRYELQGVLRSPVKFV
jgi:hypothetical protein